jgi:linoleate 10R-lipoxygenase
MHSNHYLTHSIPGYTISRAILSDAIALTRGDRYFTHDFTPYNLTAWGFADCQRDPNAFGFGSMLGRLILRTLPNNFTENSIYTFFPLMTPESMKKNLKKLGVIDQYDISRPKPTSQLIKVTGHSRVSSILKDTKNFATFYKARAEGVLDSIHGLVQRRTSNACTVAHLTVQQFLPS